MYEFYDVFLLDLILLNFERSLWIAMSNSESSDSILNYSGKKEEDQDVEMEENKNEDQEMKSEDRQENSDISGMLNDNWDDS